MAINFGKSLSQLNEQSKKAMVYHELSKEDEFILRKYCDGYLHDFKNKDLWNQKDHLVFKQLIGALPECIII